MLLSYREMLDSIPALQNLAAEKFDNIKGAYRVIRNIDKINEELEIYRKVASTLFDEYAEGEGEDRRVSTEKAPEYIEKLESLLEEEVKVDIVKLDITMLEGVKTSPTDLKMVSFMIEELQETENNGELSEKISEQKPDSGRAGDEEQERAA